ncbi:FAD binding domain-containing protein [Streptomyces sp. NPDC052015]|uniref:FAD binding domain-containing protein n=1 Tax=Streptomyces sp. NPDC052015 TaxID=3154755 RepID=UPI00341E13BA
MIDDLSAPMHGVLTAGEEQVLEESRASGVVPGRGGGRKSATHESVMEELAADPVVSERLPFVREALLLGASTQLRNMATIGGNLLQRARCR